jgi:hypothetical protein
LPSTISACMISITWLVRGRGTPFGHCFRGEDRLRSSVSELLGRLWASVVDRQRVARLHLLSESWPDRNIQIVDKPAAVFAACTDPRAPMSDDNRRLLKKILADRCLLK